MDGDTIAVDRIPVRLFGIAAPERGQPGSRAAADNLRRLISGKSVTCSKIERDRHGRDVSLCSAGGVDLSLGQVRLGHAVVWCFYVRKNHPSMLATFQRAETEAKRERRGIWARGFQPWREYDPLSS